MRKRLLFCIFGFVFFPDVCPAQEDGYVNVCAVSWVDLTSEESRTAPTFQLQRLGTFEPLVGEEERTTKSFKIPGTKVFAVASTFYTDESMAVFYTDESMAVKQGPAVNDCSASMELLVSRTGHRDAFSSLHHAEAEVMCAEPNASRVSTIFKASGKTLMLVMECRTDLRSRFDKMPVQNP